MAVELKSTVLFFNSYHIHRGICIEGTSMHLNCLHDKWKSSFIIWEEKTKMYPRTQHSHSHPRTHHRAQNTTKQALHEAWDKYKLIPFDDKTAYSTPHYRRSQSVDGIHPGGEESFQRTLAVKQQQPGVSRILRWEEAAPEKTLISWLLCFFTERSCSVLDQWLLRTVPQGKEESRRFFPFFSMERFWVSS